MPRRFSRHFLLIRYKRGITASDSVCGEFIWRNSYTYFEEERECRHNKMCKITHNRHADHSVKLMHIFHGIVYVFTEDKLFFILKAPEL